MNRKRRDAGFSLAALVLFAAAASILLTAAIPAYQLQAKRELEEELIFRGEEYVRAIQKFQRKFNGALPPDIEALLETNGVRFLRKEYKDPITGEPMRLISMNPDGTVVGSTIMTQRINNQPLFVTNPQAFGERGGQRGEGQGQRQGQEQGQRQGQAGNTEFGPRANQIVAQLQQELAERMQRLGQGGGTFRVGGGVTQQVGTTGSSGIIGVASNSDQESVKVYNEREKYNEWEFIAPLQPTRREGDPPPPPPPPPGGDPPRKN